MEAFCRRGPVCPPSRCPHGYAPAFGGQIFWPQLAIKPPACLTRGRSGPPGFSPICNLLDLVTPFSPGRPSLDLFVNLIRKKPADRRRSQFKIYGAPPQHRPGGGRAPEII